MKNSFTIYNASAGSGKTFTLVKEYLSLLFNSKKKDSYKNILAITFTNKAVEEMKTRIIASLKEFTLPETTGKNSDLFRMICEDSGLKEPEVKQKAGAILKSIIHNYAAFEISTIDGFTHRILRTFAKDLGIPVNFEVELDTNQILLEAVESLISKAGKDRKLTKTLVDFSLSKADDDKSWDITRDLFEISQLLTNENNIAPLSKLKDKKLEDFERFNAQLKEKISLTKELMLETAEEFFELMNSNGLEESDFTRKFVPNYFKKVRNGESLKFEAKWMERIAEDKLYPKAANDAKKVLLDSNQPKIAELFELSKTAWFQLEFLKEIKKRIVQLSLLNAINQEVEAIKKEHSLLLISEFNPKISEQVKNQPAPFIYERLGERYQNYFIDEFQDTSQMQWENLIPLIDHKLSSEQKEEPASLMLVGDAKQSIYRWRGGKAEQFIDLYKDLNPFAIKKDKVPLPNNFRSGGKIVGFNNEFFSYAAENLNFPDYRKLFEESYQYPKKDDYGYVNISFIEAENKEEEMELYPQKVLKIIKDLETRGTPKSDICILTRKKSEGICIANYLSEHSVPVVSSETLLIANSPEVNFISSVLKFSLNPENDELKLEIFGFLETLLQLEDPFKVLSKNLPYNGEDFFNWLEDFDLNFDLTEIQRISLYEAAEYIIRSFELVKESNAYIQFFLDYIYEISQKSSSGIQNFLDSWEQDRARLSIVVPKEENAVQIMTIHKSKGLEFPVVIYPFANADLQDTTKDSLWIDLASAEIPVSYMNASKKMLNWGEGPAEKFNELLFQKEMDNLNVLYVACTRASQQLYLLSKMEIDKRSGMERPNKVSGMLIGFLKEKGLWNDAMEYEIGDKKCIPSKEKETIPSLTQDKFYSSATQNTAVNIVTRSGSLWDSKQEKAIEKGQIVHEILARINTIQDIENEVNRALAEGILTTESKGQIQEKLQRIISHPELKEFFEDGIHNYNERDILMQDGSRLRPDRLNFKGKKVDIIDYKTGDFNPSHTAQLTNYGHSLKEMGFEVNRKILAYLNEPLTLKYVK